MSFVVSHDEETVTYFTTGNFPSEGGWLDSKAPGCRGSVFYYDRLDFVSWEFVNSTPLPAAEQWARFDPLFLLNTGTLFGVGFDPGTIGGIVCNEVAAGYWDRALNTQKVYAFSAAAANPFNEVSPLALNSVAALDVYPNVGSIASRNGLISGDPYFYNSNSGNWIFFETYGKAYCGRAHVWDATGTQKQRVMVEVDLVTGNAAIVPIPVYYGTAVSNEFTETELRGQEATFEQIQFVQDDDSVAARPKGVFYFFSDAKTNPDDSAKLRTWLKIVDWNPTGVEGVPNRVHLRERLLSAINFVKSTPAQEDGVHEPSAISYSWVYHPRSNQLFTCSNTSGGIQLAADQQKLLYATPSPAFAEITEPYAASRIATSKTVIWNVDAMGDLQEPITGQDVQFGVQNESTVDEVLATTPTPGETVTLANTVKPTDPEVSPIEVKEDGVTLTETTHYNLLRVTSQIQFVAPKPLAGGEVYTATYRHFDDPQSSPHGTIQNVYASSDENGVASARVTYDEEDPVDDRWDKISATDL